MKSLPLSSRFMVAALLASLGGEAAHAEEPHNPHTDRRERNERILREELSTRTRQCRVTGRSYFDFIDHLQI